MYSNVKRSMRSVWCFSVRQSMPRSSAREAPHGSSAATAALEVPAEERGSILAEASIVRFTQIQDNDGERSAQCGESSVWLP